jgi:hypothetical protein
MSDDDRIIALEAKIATLESTQCNCTECQASRRQRLAEQAILQQLAIERAPGFITDLMK